MIRIKVKLIIYVALLLLVNLGNNYAAIIKGRITDQSGEPLSFATVYVKGTTNGTSANEEGFYTLDVQPGSYTVTAQLMGYQSVSKNVTVANETLTLHFKLPDQSLQIKEVTVRSDAEDPAYAIMRKVIAAKKEHTKKIKSLETEIYLKGVFKVAEMPTKFMGMDISINDNDSYAEQGLDSLGRGIVYLLEQMTKYYKKEPNKELHKIMSIRQSGDPKGIGFATMPPITNIYDNNITIIEGLNKRGFISPAHNSAFLYYKFQFLGSYMNGDVMVNKIKVTPKRKYEPLFSGFVYVVEDKWVFQSVDLLLTKTAQLSQLDTLKLKQSYITDADNNWVIASQVIYPTVKIMGVGMNGNFITAYKNTKINQPIDDSLFKAKTISVYDTAANSKTSAYWDTIRPVPLETEEVKDFVLKDSLYLIKMAKNDSITKAPVTRLQPSTFLLGTPTIKRGKNTWTMNALANSINYNTVEGLNATLGLHWQHKISNANEWNINWYNRYGFVNERFQSLLQVAYRHTDTARSKRNWQVAFTGGRYVFQFNNQEPISPIMNTLYTLLGGRNYMKLYEQSVGKISFSRNWGNGFSANIGALYAQRNRLENTTSYTFDAQQQHFISANNPEVPNIPAEGHNAAIVQLSAQWQPGWRYIQYPKFRSAIPSNLPIFGVQYTKGIPGIANSKTDFDQWEFNISHKIGLRLLGNIDYRLIAGGFLNKNYVGLPDAKHLNGNQTFYAGNYLNSFQLAPYYQFSNTAPILGIGHAEWHLNGWLSNKIPALRQLNWHLVAASNVFYLNRNAYYAEASVGLENIGYKIFRFARVDFIAGYESGVSKPRLGIRLGLDSSIIQKNGASSEKNKLL